MKNCSKKSEEDCKKIGYNQFTVNEALYNNLWICYNKLDRRYGIYWREKKEKLLARHFYSG